MPGGGVAADDAFKRALWSSSLTCRDNKIVHAIILIIIIINKPENIAVVCCPCLVLKSLLLVVSKKNILKINYISLTCISSVSKFLTVSFSWSLSLHILS